MPISRPEKFTVAQTYGLAQSRRCFPTGNEPIFRYRRPGLKPESVAQFTRILTKGNSQYAIQKTGANSGSVHADHQGAPAAIPFLCSPDPLQKKSRTKPFLTLRPPRRSAMRKLSKIQQKCQFAMLSPRQPAYERSRKGPARGRFSATRPSRLTFNPRHPLPIDAIQKSERTTLCFARSIAILVDQSAFSWFL